MELVLPYLQLSRSIDNKLIKFHFRHLCFGHGQYCRGCKLLGPGVTVTGTSGNDSITGSNVMIFKRWSICRYYRGGTGNDIINGGAGADTLTGGAGDDEFDFFTEGTSTEASMDKITDYQAAPPMRIMIQLT